MIVKFCYQNEIHRCSEPPSSFEELSPFLRAMFRTTLPDEFNLFYVNSNKEEVPLTSSEDYDKLKEIDSQKPLKIVIVEKEAPKAPVSQPLEEKGPKLDSSEYEVIRQSSEVEQVVIPQVEEEKKLLSHKSDQVNEASNINSQPSEQIKEGYPEIIEMISDDFTKVHVLPRLGEANPDASTQENVRKIVKEVLSGQVPYIISQVKESLIREGLVYVPRNNEQYYGQNQHVRAGQHNWSNMSHQPYSNYENQSRPQADGPPEPDFFGSMIKAISSLPNKAIEAVDSLAQKMEGDPYVVVAEGKYTKSTVDKVEQLREIFPEESRKKLLDFVQGLPKTATLDQIVGIYVSKIEAE